MSKSEHDDSSTKSAEDSPARVSQPSLPPIPSRPPLSVNPQIPSMPPTGFGPRSLPPTMSIPPTPSMSPPRTSLAPRTSMGPTRGTQRRAKRPVALTVAALALGGVLAVAVVGGMFPSSQDTKQPATAAQPAQPVAQRPEPRPLGPSPFLAERSFETPVVATPASLPAAPKLVEEPTPPAGRKFVRYETPSDKITVHEVGEGFEIFNTDPKLAGKQVQISGITETGERVAYMLSVPNPLPTH